MSDTQQKGLPAILFSHFDGSAEQKLMASTLTALGYPVIASCEKVNRASVASAKEISCSVAEYRGDGGLRAGLEFYKDSMMDALPGVVVFEPEDGFSSDDAQRIAEAFQANPTKLVLASRARNPKLGLFSNLVKRFAALAFTAVHGRKVGDPWASLRAIPSRFVPGFLELKGDRCRLQLNMLLNLHHLGIKTVSLPVSAVYDYESGSRLPGRAFDIFRIMLLPLKFISASFTATLVDNAVFGLVGYVLTRNRLALTIIVARFAGAVTGYLLNRTIVFKTNNIGRRQELRYLAKFTLLATVNCLIALVLIPYISNTFHIYHFISKQINDGILFIASFMIQRDLIFRHKHTS